ncbi:MAG: HAMP domain-containing protein [Planctomycetes bacterium]|nr:HAMP domain-containing protein [Planctomycetota bacterium]
MRADTFFARIFLTLAGLMCVALAVAAVTGEIKLRSIVEDDAAERRKIACDLLAPSALDMLRGRGDSQSFNDCLQVLGALHGLRLTLIRADGTVMADNEAQGALSNHGERPEVVAARQTGSGEARRKSATTGKSTAYTTRALTDKGKNLGTLRAATESDQVDMMVSSLRHGIGWFGLGLLLFGLLSAALVARWLALPLKDIEGDAAELSAGNLSVQVRADGPLEVRRLGDALNAMSLELRTRLEDQRRARVEVETILASMAEGVVAVDRNERVLLMNQSAARILGLPAPLKPGSLLWETLRFPDLESSLRGALTHATPHHGDAPSPRQDGRTLGLSVAPITPGQAPATPGPLGAVALLADVTAIRRLEQVRIDFVANVSHELRTPLAAVIGALETLSDESEPATRDKFLEIAGRNAARLNAIVSDLLDLSAIESEGDRLPLEPVRLDAPLRSAASALIGEAEAKGVSLVMPPSPAIPLIVDGNSQRLEQLFTNLLENALKYTPRGGSVSVEFETVDQELRAHVRDTGIGIPAGDLTRIFERFYRVDRSRAREMGGTGLGLAIVKHIVRAHGGRVSVTSQEGVGSTFTVILPLRRRGAESIQS